MELPGPRRLTPEQATALLDLVDAEQAAVRALNTAVAIGAITRPDAVRLVEHHDAVGAEVHTLVRNLRLRSVRMGTAVHAGPATWPPAPDAVDGTVAIYKATRVPPHP